MTRYNNLFRAAEFEAELTKLNTYRALSRSAKQALYKTVATKARVRYQRDIGYIRVFKAATGLLIVKKLVPNATQPAGVAAKVSEQITALTGIVGLARIPIVEPTIPAGLIFLDNAKKFKFAKLSCVSVLGETVGATGRVFSNTYNKVNTDTVSTVFGQDSLLETFAAATASIMANAAYTAFIGIEPPAGTFSSNKIIIIPEGSN
jgi:hypothetical protein